MTDLEQPVSETGPRPPTLRFGLALGAALTTALLSALFVLDHPSGYRDAAGLALAAPTLYLAWRSSRSEDRRPQAGALLSLSLQFGVFVFWLAGAEQLAAFRLLQVAGVMAYSATLLSGLLTASGLLAPHNALLLSWLAALLVLSLESLLELGPGSEGTTLRPEWSDLLGLSPTTGTLSRPDLSGRNDAAGPPEGGRLITAEQTAQWLAHATIRRGGLGWSGRADRHPLLGMVYHPHSVLQNFYPDNPRWYFETADFRARIWTLPVVPGNAAELLLPPEDPELVRVTIQRANPDSMWAIILEKAHLKVEQAPYRVEFRARADRPRSISVGLGQAHPPWTWLGLYQKIELTPQWQSFAPNFIVTQADSNARVYFELAESNVPVEISSVVLHGREGRPVEPSLPPHRYFISYRFNASGCRGPDYATPKPEGGLRILALGDGFTMGEGVHERDTFAAQLEAEGSARSTIREVINCGVAGYGTREERLFYELFGARYKPDIVLLVMGLDDNRFYREQALRKSPDGRWSRLANVFSAARVLQGYQQMSAADYSRCVEDILRLDGEVRQQGGRLVVAILRTGWDERWDPLARTVAEGLRASSIPVLDSRNGLTADSLAGDLLVHDSDRYPNEVVHQAAATAILRFLKTVAPVDAAGK